MKKKLKYIPAFLSLICVMVLFSSCEDMLDADSDGIIFEEGNDLGSVNDTMYSAIGILSQLQKLGDRYVIFGEVRGDLMTVPNWASSELQEINNFQVSAKNSYRDKYDFYNVINNCNYAITRMDTAILLNVEKIMLPEYVAIKTMRAWTYLQLAEIFGKVIYYENPILDLESSLVEYPEVELDALVDLLITDLQPYIDIEPLDYGPIGGENSRRFFIPVKMFLGDLYLYQNKYEKAAQMYYDLMMDNPSYRISESYANRWLSISSTAQANHIHSYGGEAITFIPYSSNINEYKSKLVQLTLNPTANNNNNIISSLLPAQNFIDHMKYVRHFHTEGLGGSTITNYIEGDLRGVISFKNGTSYGDAYGNYLTNTGSISLISRYYNIASWIDGYIETEGGALVESTLLYIPYIQIYGYPDLYLRYAEAVNRAGKPTLAFTVLKHGLTNRNVHEKGYAKVNASELEGASYVDFKTISNNQNLGTAMRGRGYGITLDVQEYIIPDYTRYVDGVDDNGNTIKVPSLDPEDLLEAKQDSINWVELSILDEMAAESAFNGNRFFDLLRISRRRPNHPEFMADKVSEKYTNSGAMKSRLMVLDNWFIK